ncbi:DcaP family trimeric outer membrane transporter [Lysobacter cavernae]|uniref:DcaP family trimeric outer membrane transporter n=1 Tax=Lysobacter cavernae TaxID=1685901 RepID=A0ABV7RQU6_9GAMM
MRFRTPTIACLLALTAAPAHGQDTAESLRGEIEVLKRSLQSLEARLQAIEPTPFAATTAPAPAPGKPSTAAVASVAPQVTAGASPAVTEVPGVLPSLLPDRESVADPSSAASRVDNSASPTDPELKGFFAIPGTESMIRIGGYAKLDAIYDSRKLGDQDQFITAAIPVSSAPGSDVTNFNLHAKQTRFSFEARRQLPRGNLRFYLENDFFGGSDGYEFRLRHAYGQLGNTYAGYGYSMFMDADALPDTLDFEGPGSAPYLLVAGIHHSFEFGKGNSLTLAVENPETQIAAAEDETSTNRMPDVAATARIERDWGHLQLSGLLRRLSYIKDDSKRHDYAGGVSFTGSAAAGEQDLLLFGANWGEGIARYIADIGGSGLDAAIDANGDLRALTSYGGFFGYTHYWNQEWRSNLVYGYLHLDDEVFLSADTFRRSQYGALNLIWSPAPSWTMGMELLYGQYQQQDGRDGDALRLQGSLQYNFIK